MGKIPNISTLTLDVLGKVTKGELLSFFQWHLKNDAKAQLLFLARFSDFIKMHESEKYEWLFYKSIRLLRGSANYVGISKQKTLFKIYDELYSQAADALAIHNHIKAFYILSSGLTFLRVLKIKENTLNAHFSTIYQSYINLLIELNESDIPRALAQLLIGFVDNELKSDKAFAPEQIREFLKLKIRLEYQYNGLSGIRDYIDEEWASLNMKSRDEMTFFYHTLFSESWIVPFLDEIITTPLPSEIWKYTLLDLQREQKNTIISALWNQFHLEHVFNRDKYASFVNRIRPSISKNMTAKSKTI